MTILETKTGNAVALEESKNNPIDDEIFRPIRWRTELVPDEIPTLKQRTIVAWHKLQDMAIACNDLSWDARVWWYEHPEETKKVKLCIGLSAVSIATAFAVVYGLDWLEKLRIP